MLTEYVDEAGNPVAPPVARTGPNLPRFVVVEPQADEPVLTTPYITDVVAQEPGAQASSESAYGSDNRDGRYDDDWEDEDRDEDNEEDDDAD